jgi:hypothetical protein
MAEVLAEGVDVAGGQLEHDSGTHPCRCSLGTSYLASTSPCLLKELPAWAGDSPDRYACFRGFAWTGQPCPPTGN